MKEIWEKDGARLTINIPIHDDNPRERLWADLEFQRMQLEAHKAGWCKLT